MIDNNDEKNPTFYQQVDLMPINFEYNKLEINLPPLHLNTIDLSINSIAELQRVPKKKYNNHITQSSIMLNIPDDIWINIFSYFNINTIIIMMVTCKKVAELTNNNGIREKLHNALFYKSLLREEKATHPIYQEMTSMLQTIPAPVTLIAQNIVPEQEQYNDNPPGYGFVMR